MLKNKDLLTKFLVIVLALLIGYPLDATAAGAGDSPDMSPGAKLVEHTPEAFGPDPTYDDRKYDAEAQLAIYGGKYMNPTARPLLELGRELYTSGPFRKGINLVGKKNLLTPYAYVYGDYRLAMAYNDNGNIEKWTIANQLNLDIDVKLTATERIHAFMRPLDKNGNFTRFEFGGDVNNSDFEFQLDGNADALFFEGDMGAILQGITDKYLPIDLPFAVGLMPLLFQNGIWVEDAFTGVAFTLPAKNSPLLNISNMDTTFFFGFDKITSPALVNADGSLNDEDAQIYGLTSFIEANQGYWEVGYGYVKANDEIDDLDYHNMTAAFTRRYKGKLSNSMRVIWNFGQDRNDGLEETADGWLFLIENSLITHKPLSLIPYFNMFLGVDRPQSLARGDGVLKNTGILFETDGLTGFPKLDDTAQDTAGGAIGLNYLFSDELTDKQIVIEAAMVKDIGQNNLDGDQFAIGWRLQLPLNNATIFRSDMIAGFLENEEDVFGWRIELRRKF